MASEWLRPLTLARLARIAAGTLGLTLLLGLALNGSTGAQSQTPLVRLTASAGNDVRPAWSPDGASIAFQSNRSGLYQIWTVGVNGSGERRISQDEADDRHPSWSPDGRSIVFDSGNDLKREIWIMDLNGRGRRQVTDLGAFSTFPAWSPDGQKIAFFVYRDGVMDLWMVNADATTPRALTSQLSDQRENGCTFACHAAAWSADSRTLAFGSGDRRTVWTLLLSAGTPVAAVTGREISHFPWFLPDGRLAYVEEHVAATEAWVDVWAIPQSGNAPRELLIQKVRIQGPFEMSPDGNRLLFHSPRAGNFDIYLADLTAPGSREAMQAAPASRSVEEDQLLTVRSVSSEATGQSLLPDGVLVAAQILLYATAVFGVAFAAVRTARFYRARGRR
ncbi:MAG: PD40 domain-containing protein [Chloroflexi bacterium]|nr:PD40 domain-containing protein [Chloroflexota bacterium]